MMAYQDPYMLFTSWSSNMHISARAIASRHLRTDPNSETSVRVRKADAHCKELYESRAEALRVLRNLDSTYQDTWETVYKMSTGKE